MILLIHVIVYINLWIKLMGEVIWIEGWPVPSGKKKNQMESLPARQVRNATKAREDSPHYGTALDEQNAKRDMLIYRASQFSIVPSTVTI
jgi:hypothetical protein